MELKTVSIAALEGTNTIVGQSHFIKTVEDIYEALVNSVPNIKFGIGFCESSGPRLVRHAGNDSELRRMAKEKALEIAAGHSFVIFIRGAYPINILGAIRNVPEMCNIFCASANTVQVVLAETQQGRGILGVIDGQPPLGSEGERDERDRELFLRKIGYKLGSQ
ncbi:MAG: adenosine-specific kinase [Thaumarchaeota archaeon]|nr:adenosine-specific kinase [Nitrososphaerota archaeon]